MVGFAAIAAYGITMFSFFQLDSRGPKSGSDGATIGQMSHEPARDARQRLVVEDQQAFANEPILLAVVAVPTTSSGSLSLRGLAHGTRLSAGAALDEDGWELSLRDIGSAYVYAPPDFVGVMNATIALLSPSNEVIDSRPIRLEWIAKANSPQPPNKREIDSETCQRRYQTGDQSGAGETGDQSGNGERRCQTGDQSGTGERCCRETSRPARSCSPNGARSRFTEKRRRCVSPTCFPSPS